MDTVQVNDTMEKGTSSMWQYYFTDIADPRTNNWFLISNPIPVAIIIFCYLYFVKVCGPRYMKNKKPYQLKRLIRIYNLMQVAINIWMFREGVYMWSRYNWMCQPMDYSYSPDALRGAWACYVYFLNKISDLADTVFFVLRKKDKQISFLHVFHHTLMPCATWCIVKYSPGGHATFVGLLNTFVHILLYAYYYLAAFGPAVQKYLWWKKHLTRIQLIQFCLVFIHSCQLLVFECDYPKWTLFISIPNAVFFYYLFSDFYHKSYTKEDAKKQVTQNGNSEKVKAK